VLLWMAGRFLILRNKVPRWVFFPPFLGFSSRNHVASGFTEEPEDVQESANGYEKGPLNLAKR
jgi:hypothetical protein